MIKDILQQLNPKAYMQYYQELLNDQIQVFYDIYNNRYTYYFLKQIKPATNKRVTELNDIVTEYISMNNQLLDIQKQNFEQT